MDIFTVTVANAETLLWADTVRHIAKELGVYALTAGVNHRVAAFGYRGGSLFERLDFSMAGALVKHRKGDLLIDTGFGRQIDAQFRTLPFGPCYHVL